MVGKDALARGVDLETALQHSDGPRDVPRELLGREPVAQEDVVRIQSGTYT